MVSSSLYSTGSSFARSSGTSACPSSSRWGSSTCPLLSSSPSFGSSTCPVFSLVMLSFSASRTELVRSLCNRLLLRVELVPCRALLRKLPTLSFHLSLLSLPLSLPPSFLSSIIHPTFIPSILVYLIVPSPIPSLESSSISFVPSSFVLPSPSFPTVLSPTFVSSLSLVFI